MDGEIHYYCKPVRVPEEMEKKIEMISTAQFHPLELSARVHHRLVAIHPFDDGNGRVARFLMNLILIKNGYLPVIIRQERREDYYKALIKADGGVAREEKNSLQTVIGVLKGAV